VAYILWQKGENYRFVGESYVYGNMDVEVLKEYEKSGNDLECSLLRKNLKAGMDVRRLMKTCNMDRYHYCHFSDVRLTVSPFPGNVESGISSV
jgi:hypothetical protein